MRTRLLRIAGKAGGITPAKLEKALRDVMNAVPDDNHAKKYIEKGFSDFIKSVNACISLGLSPVTFGPDKEQIPHVMLRKVYGHIVISVIVDATMGDELRITAFALPDPSSFGIATLGDLKKRVGAISIIDAPEYINGDIPTVKRAIAAAKAFQGI